MTNVLLRWTAVAAVLGVLGITIAPAAGGLTAFIITTLWVHGPVSPLLPAAYEPVLMHYGTLYPPLLVALTGAVTNVFIEALNYRLYGDMLETAALARIRESRLARWTLELFRRAPFLTVWIGSWSPVPDWAVRLLAPMARYPLPKYLLAMALGRLPRYWLFAEAGYRLGVSGRMAMIALVLSVLAGVSVVLSKLLARKRALNPEPAR